MEEDFDNMLNDFEKTLDENDKLIGEVKGKLKGDFLKLLEKF